MGGAVTKSKAHQPAASGERGQGPNQPASPTVSQPRRPLQSSAAVATPSAEGISDDDSFQAAVKKNFDGVPGLLHTIQTVRQKCQSGRYEDAFEELQMFIFQDAEIPPIRETDKTNCIQRLMDILSEPDTAGMDNRIKLRFFEAIKRLAVSDSVRQSSQTLFSSAEQRIFNPIYEHKKTLEAKLSDMDKESASGSVESFRYNPDSDVFLIDKTLYNLEAIEKLLRAGIQFVKARKDKTKRGRKLTELVSKIGGAATCDGQSIAWLVAKGVKLAWQTAKQDSTNSTATEVLIVEQYNDLILKHGILIEKAKLWVSDLETVLAAKFQDLRPQKDWLVVYACVECLLNIGFRFPAAQTEVLDVISKPLKWKLWSSLNPYTRARDSFRDTSDFQRRIQFKYVEALAQLALWGQTDIQDRAAKVLDEHRSRGLPALTRKGSSIFLLVAVKGSSIFLRHVLEQNPVRYRDILAYPAAADFAWIETVSAACKSLFTREPLREANTILDIMNQEFARSRTVHENVTDLVRIMWPHIPQDIIRDIDGGAARCGRDRTESACRRLFIRSLTLAFSCTLRSIRVPDHLGLSDRTDSDKPDPTELSSAAVQAEDIMARPSHSSAESASGSSENGDGSERWGGSSEESDSEEVAEVTAEQLASVRQSIRTISEHIEQGSASISARGLRNVVVVGVTGSGKSTLVNALAGCDIRPLTDEEAEAQCVPADALTVKLVSEGGARDPVTVIGNQTNCSQTEVLRATEIVSRNPEGSFLLWDAPGFLDSHGPEISIANAVNLTNLLNASQEEGLIVVVVVDADSISASRGAALRDTVKILVHLFGNEKGRLDNSVMAGTLFCVTKAPDAHRLPLKRLRKWIVDAGGQEGLELENHLEQILVFDPLPVKRNVEGSGAEDLRERLLGIRPLLNMKTSTTSLTDADTNLLHRIAHVLKLDVTNSLEKCHFADVKNHLHLFNSLRVISNSAVEEHSKTVLGSISERASKWAGIVNAKLNKFTLVARKEMRVYLDKLKQSQILEDELVPLFSLKALYVDCYEAVRDSEKRRQEQETQELENMFTTASAKLRTALSQRCDMDPDFFRRFDASEWSCDDCVRNYASVKEVQDLKVVLDKAKTYRIGRMPDQLYMFGEHGDLAALIGKFQKQVLTLFSGAQHRGRCTVLDRSFTTVLAELREQLRKQMKGKRKESIDFFSKEALRVADVPSLKFYGMDPLAGKLHEILTELQLGHNEVYKRKAVELEQYFMEVHQEAVDLEVDRAATLIKQRQDSFAETVRGKMETLFEKICDEGYNFLGAELRTVSKDYDVLWARVLLHDSFASVSRVKRELQAREKQKLDELALAAESFMQQRAADKKDTEAKIRGKMEQLNQLSHEVVKGDFSNLMIKRLAVAKLSDLILRGFEKQVVVELDEHLKRMSRIDNVLYDSLSCELDVFLEQLQERALAESAAKKLTQGYTDFENRMRSQLPKMAQSIVDEHVDLSSELHQTVIQYSQLWEELKSREELPCVGDTIMGLKRKETDISSRLRTEAEQFLRSLASDRKQRALEFEQLMTEIKKEKEPVLRENYAGLSLLDTERSTVSQLADFGFNPARVGKLSSLLAVLREDDAAEHERQSTELNKFLVHVHELAEAWSASVLFQNGLVQFGASIRSAIYEKAPALAGGGQAALQKELDATFPQHRELLNSLVDGPQAREPIVLALAAEARQEMDSLLLQLERELTDYIKNLHAERKQGLQQFSALVLKLQASSDVVEQHCEELAGNWLDVQPEKFLLLCKYGFEEDLIQEINRMLVYFHDNDAEMYPDCAAELGQALKIIQSNATDFWVEKLKADVMLLLDEGKEKLFSEIDGWAADSASGSISIEDLCLEELLTDKVTDLIIKITSCGTQRSEAADQSIKAEQKRIILSFKQSAEERFKIMEAQAKLQRREAITTTITSLLTHLKDHQEKHQKELAEAMNDLLDLNGRTPEYEKIVDIVRTHLNSLQHDREIQRILGSDDFVGLNARCQMLDRLKKLLKEHKGIVPNNLIHIVVTRRMTDLLKEVDQELDADISSSSYLQFTSLRYFCRTYDEAEKIFPELGEQRSALLQKAHSKQREMLIKVRDMVQQDEPTNTAFNGKGQHFVAKLLIKGYGVSLALQFRDHFKTNVEEELIRKCDDRQKYDIGMALMEYITQHHSEDDGVKEMASIIIDTFPAFKSFNIALFNAKADAVGFPEALDKLRCEPRPCDRVALTRAYESFFKEYDVLVNHVVQNIAGFPLDQVKVRIFDSSKLLGQHAMKLGDKIEEIGELLGLVCGLWTYLSNEDSTTRMEKRQVMQPHSTQLLGILRLLGLDQDGLANHLIQINTGEGKSIALGFAATILALLGFHVDVVCYSSYLSERDSQAFEKLFQVLDVDSKVSYSDFQQLSNRIMQNGMLDFPDMRQVFQSFLEKRQYQHRQKQQGRSVLLLDEVDVFFSDAFYGTTFNPVESIQAPEAHELVMFVWKNRGRLFHCNEHVEELLRREDTQKLQKRFPNLSSRLLSMEFRRLLNDVRSFPEGGQPKLSGLPPHIVDKKRQRIGYSDEVRGVPDYNMSFGYITAFTYLHCVENNELLLDKVKHNITFQVRCGSLLYSRIPSFYTVCLGMTGTLDCLSDVQNRLLGKFNFQRRTFLPSTFRRKTLNQNESSESVETIVEVGSYNEYFERIKSDIEEQVKRGRATLVVFEDQTRLDKFANEINLRQPDLKQYQTPKVLSDKLSNTERGYVVDQAIRRFATTFVTRSYGRGTDFACRDDGLVKNGGVHLIVTFYPRDESENKQINGRTCRQDNPGSARKILHEDDLKHLSATETDKASTGLSWDDYLACRRTDHEAKRYEEMEESETNSKQTHDDTLRAYEAVKNGQWDSAAALFENFGGGLSRRSKGVCRLMCLSDATASMDSLWSSALRSINTVLERISLISAGRGVISIKWVAYRDYDNYENNRILEESSWTNDARSLTQFLSKVKCTGGEDMPEAVDYALNCANREAHSPTQVLLIGDAPPHFEKVGQKLRNCCNQCLRYDWRVECQQLKNKGIPVHTFALGTHPETRQAFWEIAALTGGRYQEFSEESLLDILCLQALEEMGGEEMTNRYKAQYMNSSINPP